MSRRSWSREIGNPLTMFTEKRKNPREDASWSMFRVILFGFFLGFVYNWPSPLNGPGAALGACIIFGLPVRDLFEKVPVSEALGAIHAFFGNVMGKAAAAVADRWSAFGPANDGAPGGDLVG